MKAARPRTTSSRDGLANLPLSFPLRKASLLHGDGSASAGRIDRYLRGHFVLDVKMV